MFAFNNVQLTLPVLYGQSDNRYVEDIEEYHTLLTYPPQNQHLAGSI